MKVSAKVQCLITAMSTSVINPDYPKDDNPGRVLGLGPSKAKS